MRSRHRRFGVNTLADLVGLWCRQNPSSIAVGGLREARTFAELDADANLWASALRAAGLKPGERVALWGGNSARWLARAFGVWKAGLTLVPLSTFATPRELTELLNNARPQLLLADRRVADRDFAALVRQLSLPPSLRRMVAEGPGQLTDLHSEASFLRAGSYRFDASGVTQPQDVALILYTSGTTGKPKGVRLQHQAVLSTMWATVARGGLRLGDRVVSSLPLFWVAGLCIRALPTLASGSALLLMETFHVDQLIELLKQWRPNGLHLRPPQVSALLSHPRFAPELLEPVRKGGGRNSWYAPHLRHARLITGYGMTEMSGYVTALSWRDSAATRASSIGRTLPDVEVKIVGKDGSTCEAGVTGEIRVRGPGLFAGYEGEPTGTGIDTHGYFCTGDLGFLDETGQLHFVGRSKDLLRCKGVNVSPLEVEVVLAEHPSVEAAFVVGLPPDGLDQQLVALVVSRDGQDHEVEWRQWCARMLSPYKRPSAFVLVRRGEVPFGPTSKPLRDQLARLALERLSGMASLFQL